MGSYNVGCGISNLSVNHGEEIGVVILRETPDYLSYQKIPKSGRSLYVYNTDIYKPLVPPVFGSYDDYGGIEDIEESATTKFLEQKFLKCIDEVLACIHCDRGIYSQYGKIHEFYADKTSEFYGYGSASIGERLVMLGFTKGDGEKSGVEVYSFGGFNLFHYPENGQWVVGRESDSKILVKFAHPNDAGDVMAVFGEYTRIYPGFAPEHYDAIRELDKLSGMFFLKNVFEKMDEYFSSERFIKRGYARFEERWDEFMQEIKEAGDDVRFVSSWNGDGKDFISRSTALSPADFDHLGMFDGSDDYRKLYSFLTMTDSLNRFLMPSYNGEQLGNDKASLALNKVTNKLLKERIKALNDF